MNLFGFFYGGGGHESDRQAHPEGLRLFFSVIKWHWGRLIGLNLVFLLTCIPVVTIPCAMTAMSKVTGLFLQRRICYPMHDYFKAFAAEWKRSTLAGWAALIVAALGVVAAWFYTHVGMTGGVVLAGICLIFSLVAVAAMVYLFPMIAFTDLKVRDLLRNAVLLSQMKLPQTLAVLALSVVIVASSYLFLPWTVWVMPLFGFSLIALMGTYVAWNAMKQHVIRDDNPSSASLSYADGLDGEDAGDSRPADPVRKIASPAVA